jgi:predicted ATPase
MGNGFFLRAEMFFKFVEGLDIYSHDGINVNETLKRKSHGESFITVFESRFGKRGLYILDEPEAALSPRRQTELIQLLHRLEKNDQCQFIIATHSPLLMAYPNADLRYIEDGKFKKKEFHEIEHFKLMRDFYMYPDGFIAGLLQTEND